MPLLDLPNEIVLLIAACLDDADDKFAFLRTCHRVHDLTRTNLYRFLAVDRHADAAIWALLARNTAILDALWQYNPRLVHRYWKYDPEPSKNWNVRDWYQINYPCPVCEVEDCKHPAHPDNTDLDQNLMGSVLDRLGLPTVTTCFESPRRGEFTLLHLSALYNDTRLLSWLLDHGASIDAPCVLMGCRESVEDGDFPILTPLQLAMCARNQEAARLLTERDASLDAMEGPRDGTPGVRHQVHCCTPAICSAAAFGLVDTLRLFLHIGVEVDSRDGWGYTPLHHAADLCWQEEDFGVFQVLLDAGADLNDRYNVTRRTPLEIAFRQGNFAAVEHLLGLGATVDQVLHEDSSARLGLNLLHFTCAFEARSRGRRHSLHSCFSLSPSDEVKFSYHSWEAARQALVLRLLDLGFDPNSPASLNHPWCRDNTEGYIPPHGPPDRAGRETRLRSHILPWSNVTAISAASFDCGADLMRLLIRRGVDVNVQDSNSMTVLWLLCLNHTILDGLFANWHRAFDFPGPVVQWREKMELVLRAGAKLDPWPEDENGRLSEIAINLMRGLDNGMFDFMVEKLTNENISNAALGRLAGGLLAASQLDKTLLVLKCHSDVRLEAMEHEAYLPKASELSGSKQDAEELLKYPLPAEVQGQLQNLLLRESVREVVQALSTTR